MSNEIRNRVDKNRLAVASAPYKEEYRWGGHRFVESITNRFLNDIDLFFVAHKYLVEKPDKSGTLSRWIIAVRQKVRCKDIGCVGYENSFIHFIKTIHQGQVVNLVGQSHDHFR